MTADTPTDKNALPFGITDARQPADKNATPSASTETPQQAFDALAARLASHNLAVPNSTTAQTLKTTLQPVDALCEKYTEKLELITDSLANKFYQKYPALQDDDGEGLPVEDGLIYIDPFDPEYAKARNFTPQQNKLVAALVSWGNQSLKKLFLRFLKKSQALTGSILATTTPLNKTTAAAFVKGVLPVAGNVMVEPVAQLYARLQFEDDPRVYLLKDQGYETQLSIVYPDKTRLLFTREWEPVIDDGEDDNPDDSVDDIGDEMDYRRLVYVFTHTQALPGQTVNPGTLNRKSSPQAWQHFFDHPDDMTDDLDDDNDDDYVDPTEAPPVGDYTLLRLRQLVLSRLGL